LIAIFYTFGSKVKQAGVGWRALACGPGSRGFVGLPVFLVFLGDHRRFLDAITFAGDGNGLGAVQEPVDDGQQWAERPAPSPSGRLLVTDLIPIVLIAELTS
jgi:hypothetical protein